MTRVAAAALLLLVAGCATAPLAPAGISGEAWHLQAAASASAALYGPPDSEARFAIRCEADRRRIVLVAVGASRADRLGIRIDGRETRLPTRFEEEGLPALVADVALDDAMLDRLATAPRFAIAVGEAGDVTLPGDPAIGQVIRSCRRPA